jgi:hypothetical protein
VAPSPRRRGFLPAGASGCDHPGAVAHTFFRIVLGPEATGQDFLSDIARGKPPRTGDPEALRLAEGFSAFATLAQARNKARAYPFLGA